MKKITNIFVFDREKNFIFTCPIIEREGENDLWLFFKFNNEKCQFFNNGVQVRGLDRPFKEVNYDYLVSTNFESLLEIKKHINTYTCALSKIFDDVVQYHR